MTNDGLPGSDPPPTLTGAHHEAALAGFRRLGLGLHDAEDCAQTTMLRVHGSLDCYEPRAPLGAFIRRVAHSVYVDWCRWRRVRRGEREPQPLEEALHAAAPARLDAEHVIDLRAALETLPPKLAAVVKLAMVEGLPYRDVASGLGIPVGTVKSRMFLAVQHLRRELADGS